MPNETINSILSSDVRMDVLWAKSSPRWPLWKHLLDTAAMSLALPNPLASFDWAAEQTALLVGLHDIGKADSNFQHQVSEFSSELIEAGFTVTGDAWCRHERLSARFVERKLEGVGLDRFTASAIARAVIAHHGYLVVQPVAVTWSEDQRIVWPTKGNPVEGMKFSTEQFVEAVIEDVRGELKLNDERIFTLSWSSSGPAAYAVALQEETAVRGSLIAMSVFKPTVLPPLEHAKGHRFFLLHSPDDRVCPFRMAKDAEQKLSQAGANILFREYPGGHGWRGPIWKNIRDGIEWLPRDAESDDS